MKAIIKTVNFKIIFFKFTVSGEYIIMILFQKLIKNKLKKKKMFKPFVDIVNVNRN